MQENVGTERGAGNVTLYSTGCPKCAVLKRKLGERHIAYDENDSVEDMTALGITQVPVLAVNGKLLNFSEAVDWVDSRTEEVN